MSKLHIHIGETFDAVASRASQAWREAEKGKPVCEDHVTFADWDILAKIMSPKRYQLLRHVHHHPEKSVASLARALQRDYKRVHDDVEMLSSAGLLQRAEGLLRVDYDVIESRISL